MMSVAVTASPQPLRCFASCCIASSPTMGSQPRRHTDAPIIPSAFPCQATVRNDLKTRDTQGRYQPVRRGSDTAESQSSDLTCSDHLKTPARTRYYPAWKEIRRHFPSLPGVGLPGWQNPYWAHNY